MRLELTGRHVVITPALRKLVDRKLAPIQRLLNDRLVSSQVVLTKEKNRQHVEMTIHARGEKFFHGVGEEATWETSLTSAVDKITQQAQRVKGKWEERRRRAKRARAREDAIPVEPSGGDGGVSPRVIRAARYAVKPMTIDEAALQMDGASDPFLVFRNARTEDINVLYRRKNGDLALIEP
jgi:putative sigma-54 modulation protein